MTTLLTTAQTAKMLQLSEEWVRAHASGKRRPILPAVKIKSGLKTIYRFEEESFYECLC